MSDEILEYPVFNIDVDINNNTIINPTGKYEVMLFFDYNCSYCKKEIQIVKQLMSSKKDIRLLIKPLPILGEFSLWAAEVGHAILVSEPQKYLKYFEFVMDEYNFEDDLVYKALLYSSINIDKIKLLIDSIKLTIDKLIEKDVKLSKTFGIEGTPSFVVNNKVIGGIFEFDKLKEKILGIL